MELHGFPIDSDLDIPADHDDANVGATAQYMSTHLNLAHGEDWQEMLLDEDIVQEAFIEGPEDGDPVALTQERDRFLDLLASLEAFSGGVGETLNLMKQGSQQHQNMSSHFKECSGC